MGVGISLAMLLGVQPGRAQVGTFTAIFFAVGVGLPGGSISDAGERLVLSLLGGLWAFLGIYLRLYFASRRKSLGGVGSSTKETLAETISQATPLANQSDAPPQTSTVGAASAVGLTVGLLLGLRRDFWIVVTIILGLPPSIPATINFSSMIVVGTLVGALIPASVTFLGNQRLLSLDISTSIRGSVSLNQRHEPRALAGIHDAIYNRPSQHTLSWGMAARRSADSLCRDRRSDSSVDRPNS